MQMSFRRSELRWMAEAGHQIWIVDGAIELHAHPPRNGAWVCSCEDMFERCHDIALVVDIVSPSAPNATARTAWANSLIGLIAVPLPGHRCLAFGALHDGARYELRRALFVAARRGGWTVRIPGNGIDVLSWDAVIETIKEAL